MDRVGSGGDVVGVAGDGRRVVGLLVRGAERLVFPVPADITDAQALVLVREGVIAWHLLRTCAHVRAGESVVVHGAADAVGLLAVQLARSFGAGQVVATAGTPEGRGWATAAGADAVVDSGAEGLRARLLSVNGGDPVDVVLSPVGGAVFRQSLEVLAPFGRLVGHGESFLADSVGPIAGSRAVIGFRLGDCLARPEMVAGALSELMGLTSAGRLRPPVDDEYPLSEAGSAAAGPLTRRAFDPRR
ncbi:zinc-binding dehydrogenase [Umezawaea sp. Da 62-37]|uniref:zinc-binding dehydrogenase n=1 Tax=Umezawaea sp. Da 62-37 TaxID=3075927 RepID=UPI0028F6C2E3|nr:zinc-binding dehydrogenase [Umezawaea sp. Da 62-37]WNV89369.1 zinc-binding dehydrogenase [Umezawaea sp. Da 62-37]